MRYLGTIYSDGEIMDMMREVGGEKKKKMEINFTFIDWNW